ncbi:MAG: hypothetical protein QXP70_04510 [Methanomassiliicoccales archaeon]
MAAVIISLITVNIYTAEQLGLRSPSPVPGIPELMIGDFQNNTTVLIHAALGPYAYSVIQIVGNYTLSTGAALELKKTTYDSYYLGIEMENVTTLNFNSTALDLQNKEIYYFNASVTINMSDTTSDRVTTVNGGQTNYIILGADPFTASMEVAAYA